jgi:hypothetical protein
LSNRKMGWYYLIMAQLFKGDNNMLLALLCYWRLIKSLHFRFVKGCNVLIKLALCWICTKNPSNIYVPLSDFNLKPMHQKYVCSFHLQSWIADTKV